MLIFILFCSKDCFRLFSAKLRCFHHYVSENRLFLVFLRKLCFWPFILSRACFGVLARKSDVSSILLQKAISFFVCEYPFLSLIVAKIRFCMLATKSRCFEFFVRKKSVFAFLLLKHVRLSTENMFWFVCCNIGLFSVLLHQKKVFFQYAGSHPGFHLILLKQRFCFVLVKLRGLRIVFLRRTLFSVSVTKLHFGRLILPKKCFGLLAT